MAGHFYLEYVDDEGRPERYRLDGLPCTVGRGEASEVQLPIEQISRRHARFESDRDGLTLTDLESTNGTFVNLERIHAPTLVRPGDSVHFANHEFRLILDDPKGETMIAQRANRASPAGQTLAGFTAEPVGFPVQAPQFYELLNEELISPRTQPIVTPSGRTYGVILSAVSTYSKLNIGYSELRHLAEQMGEESRFNALVRQQGLKAAEKADLINPVIFVDIQAGEMEDPDILVDELEQLVRQYSRLLLAFVIPPVGVARTALDEIARTLKSLDVELALSGIDPADPRQVLLCNELADYVFIGSDHEPDSVKEALEELGASPRVIIERIDDPATEKPFRALETALLCGNAIGEPEAIS